LHRRPPARRRLKQNHRPKLHENHLTSIYRPRQDIIKRYFIYLIVFFIILVVVLALVFFINSVLNK
jgi:t-SNARE complex subunit (syntaxin)